MCTYEATFVYVNCQLLCMLTVSVGVMVRTCYMYANVYLPVRVSVNS